MFSYQEELPLERLDEGESADGKGGLLHLHLDILMITEDNRLSAKTLITRDFITSMHRIMPIILKKQGFNIDDKAELERKNKEKAYEIMYQRSEIGRVLLIIRTNLI